jgi:hypothetical protein
MSGILHLLRYDFDKALNLDGTESYFLSIRVSTDGFSFCIYDNKRAKFAAIADWDFQGVANPLAFSNLLSEFLPSQEWLQKKYQKTSLFIENTNATLVPKPLFIKDNSRDYLALNHSIAEDDIIKYDLLQLPEAVNVFSIPKIIYNKLVHQFPSATIHHHSSSLIQTILLMSKNQSNETETYVNVRNNSFDIIIAKNNELLFYNSFPFGTKEDFIYYLIFVLEQLNLNPEEISVILLGNVSKISSVYEITYKYIRKIGFGNRNENFDYSYIFDDFPRHYYFNLIHATHCEL